jgi:hypothetical protein
MRFVFKIVRRLGDAVLSKVAWWVAEIIFNYLYAWAVRLVLSARTLTARTGGRIKACWNVVRNISQMSIVNMATGEIHLGCGA